MCVVLFLDVVQKYAMSHFYLFSIIMFMFLKLEMCHYNTSNQASNISARVSPANEHTAPGGRGCGPVAEPCTRANHPDFWRVVISTTLIAAFLLAKNATTAVTIFFGGKQKYVPGLKL